MKIGFVNIPMHIELQLDDASADKYPVALVYDSTDTLLASVNLDAAGSDGTYTSEYTFIASGYTYILYKIYDDVARTELDQNYSFDLESIYVYDTSGAEATAIAAAVWAAPTRSLNVPVDTTLDISELATKTDLDTLYTELLEGIHTWEAKGSVSYDPSTNSMELVAWLSSNGVTILDATSATVELRDGDENIVIPSMTDSVVSPTGLFKFTKPNANGILLKNRTYVMRINITRGANSYLGNVSISTY